ncbi:uncharacterized protein LOC105437474 [Strongylocentrotus purpuratus]|uniref:MAPEG family protein n=1 Tax=Strongylocentrotus purpuratus TaxID=7668 RepID=A0A7M7HII6_STRPU|nr:uncharacterized protein LOC105437474 [Strongylocentrotus purpuratus]|eukprot:XP_011662412.1 PREDICTED: uncharacterized protein LOC105437474 [Strongylocentrotus purpuratus]
MFSSKQWTIMIQVSASACFVIAVRYVFKENFASFPPELSDGERFKFVFRCLAFSSLPLFAAVRKVASVRFSNMETLGADPIAPVAPSQKAFKIAERVLQNTLEQTLLHVMTILALASSVVVDQLYIIPCMVLLFCIGRFVYYVGYSYDPLYRGFGFGTTWIPTLIGFSYALFIIASRALFG